MKNLSDKIFELEKLFDESICERYEKRNPKSDKPFYVSIDRRIFTDPCQQRRDNIDVI